MNEQVLDKVQELLSTYFAADDDELIEHDEAQLAFIEDVDKQNAEVPSYRQLFDI